MITKKGLPQMTTAPDTNRIEVLPIHNVRPSAWNSRVAKEGDAARLSVLAASIKEQGQLTPIQVMGPDDKGGYEVVFGNRRLKACKMAGVTTVNAQVIAPVAANVAMVRNAVENAVRQDLSPFEMARVCSQLRGAGLKNEEVGTTLGLSQQMVSNYAITFENLHPDILEDWRKGEDAATMAVLRPLANEKDPVKQLQAYDEAVAAKKAHKADPERVKSGPKKKGDGGGGAPIRAITGRLTESVLFAKKRAGSAPDVLKNKDGSDGNAQRLWLKHFVIWLIGESEKRPPGFPEVETGE